MLRIGEFSKLSRISIRMLRHYDEIGLLKPAHIDPHSGYRLYDEAQLTVVGRITFWKEMGFGLSVIGQLLTHYEDKGMLERHLLLQKTALEDEYSKIAYRLQLVEIALERMRKDEMMKYEVTLKHFPERYAATVRMTIPCYEQEGMLWNILTEETAPLSLTVDEPCYCCAVFHDQEHKESDVDVEVYQTVKGNYPDTAHVKFRTLPKVTVACTTYQGSYERIGEAIATVAQWVTEHGYVFDGPAFNIYHVSPHETSNPDDFVTEVCYPVQKKSLPKNST